LSELLFSLIRDALWGHNFEKDVMIGNHTLKEIITIAKKQSLLGLIADGLLNRNTEGISHEIKMNLFSYLLSVEKSNRQVNQELTGFSSLLNQNGIKFCVVKGQTVGSLYANPKLRTAGDIDAYCCEQDLLKLKELLEKREIAIVDDFSSRHLSFEYHGVEFEIHYKLTNFNTYTNQRYWDELVEKDVMNDAGSVVIDGMEIPTLSPTLNAAFVFIHLYHHFLKEGVGLRQFCDWAMVLHHEHDNIDRTRLTEILSKLGYLKAYRALGSILTNQLGLPTENFPYTITENNKKYGRRVLKEVMKGGNFGWYGRWTNKSGILHSIETGTISVRHCLKYCALSPKENLMFLPMQTYRSIIKNWGLLKIKW
jgi:hypothetical protein